MNKVIILYEYIVGIAVVNICMCRSRAVSPGAARLETKYLGGRIMPPPSHLHECLGRRAFKGSYG